VVRSARIARLSLLTVAVLAATAAPARGYVRSRVDGGIPKYWQTSCVPLTIYLNGFAAMTRDEVAKSIGAAAHAWSPTEVTCGDGSHPFLEIVPTIAPNDAVPPAPAYDGQNTLIFFNSDETLGPGVVALTSTWARADGHIVDGDVRINAGQGMDWANRDPGFTPSNGLDPYDLQNAVTHELGHLIGLGHTCWNGLSDLEQPIDDKDAGVPTCGTSAPAEVRETVMYANIELPSETTKRVLSPDDVRAVCEIYPSMDDPQSCAVDVPDDGCGCSAGAGAAGTTFIGLLAALAALAIALGRRTARPVATFRRARRAGRG
jgi:MYXO-CTERM domain-containing protein